jgi:hypothetical protein
MGKVTALTMAGFSRISSYGKRQSFLRQGWTMLVLHTAEADSPHTHPHRRHRSTRPQHSTPGCEETSTQVSSTRRERCSPPGWEKHPDRSLLHPGPVAGYELALAEWHVPGSQ